MKPIKVSLLWHYHQPYYRKDNLFILPWVRFHGIKDYLDIPEIFYEFPNIRQTINVVPALQKQIDEYVADDVKDRVQLLSEISPTKLTNDQKREILTQFFVINHENMVKPYPRYWELLNRSSDIDVALRDFSNSDWCDLQVWYNLAWTGQFSRKLNFIKMLIKKDRNYNEVEKSLLLDYQKSILRDIPQQLTRLSQLEYIDISVTPYYHPILPLLIDSNSAKESKGTMVMPELRFTYPQDAEWHIHQAISFVSDRMGHQPSGMWPSEGSISNKALELIARNGVKWVGADEEVLRNSDPSFVDLHKYFPRKFQFDGGEISMFFRDHNLSDAIGFIYSNWDPGHAAYDFAMRIKQIRSNLIETYGEDSLDNAVVSIILDGENCWEFYPDNGIHFLRHLYTRLGMEDEIETVLFSQECSNTNYLPPIKSITAGSWINGNFDIWFAHSDHRIAWTELSRIRDLIESMKDEIDDDLLSLVMEEIYIAEGSDWFWWYGDTHNAPNKPDFDELFRWRLQKIYAMLGVPHPEILNNSLSNTKLDEVFKQNYTQINPIIDGVVSSPDEWQGSGYFNAAMSSADMHQSGEFLSKIYLGNNSEYLFLRIDCLCMDTNREIRLILNSLTLIISQNTVLLRDEFRSGHLKYSMGSIVEIEIDKCNFFNSIDLVVETYSEGKMIRYPRQGELKFDLV